MQSTRRTFFGVTGFLSAGIASALVVVEDAAGLPRVLIIGDSISIGYTIPLRTLLAGKANVHRITTNGGPTSNGVANIDKWLGDQKWDLIHFNFGLHDLKIMDTGKHQVPIEDYEKNLETLVARMQKTGAKLIWATTTPVPEGKLNPPRDPADVLKFNEVALAVMQRRRVAVNDLYTAMLPNVATMQLPVNVHFKPEGYEFLATRCASAIRKELRIAD
jgi:acyl-CoA thioesterase-1